MSIQLLVIPGRTYIECVARELIKLNRAPQPLSSFCQCPIKIMHKENSIVFSLQWKPHLPWEYLALSQVHTALQQVLMRLASPLRTAIKPSWWDPANSEPPAQVRVQHFKSLEHTQAGKLPLSDSTHLLNTLPDADVNSWHLNPSRGHSLMSMAEYFPLTVL